MTREGWARLSAGLLAAAALWAIWPPLSGALARGEGLFEAIWNLLRMFTIITNFLVGLIFARIAWRETESIPPLVIGGLMLGIVLVGVVFNLLLTMLPHQTIWDAVGDYVHHVAAPIAVPLWWATFGRWTELNFCWTAHEVGLTFLAVIGAELLGQALKKGPRVGSLERRGLSSVNCLQTTYQPCL